MSNKVPSAALENNQTDYNENQFAVLQDEDDFETHMKKLKAEKQKEVEVIASGEVSKMVKKPNGKIVIASEYLNLYQDYEDNITSQQSEQSQGLDQAIWSLGHNLALLDVDSNIVSKIDTNSEINVDSLDPTSADLYKKTWNNLLDIIDSNDANQAKYIIEKMGATGKTGKYFADLFETLDELITEDGFTSEGLRYRAEESQSVNISEVGSDSKELLNLLERDFFATMSSGEISHESVDELYARYSDLLRMTYESKDIELIEERLKKLSTLSDQLEAIDKKISSFDE